MMLSFMQVLSNLSNMPIKLNYTHKDSTGKTTDQSFLTSPEQGAADTNACEVHLNTETTLNLSELASDVKESFIDLTQDQPAEVIDLTEEQPAEVIDLTQEPPKEARLQTLLKALEEAHKLLEARVETLEAHWMHAT